MPFLNQKQQPPIKCRLLSDAMKNYNEDERNAVMTFINTQNLEIFVQEYAKKLTIGGNEKEQAIEKYRFGLNGLQGVCNTFSIGKSNPVNYMDHASIIQWDKRQLQYTVDCVLATTKLHDAITANDINKDAVSNASDTFNQATNMPILGKVALYMDWIAYSASVLIVGSIAGQTIGLLGLGLAASTSGGLAASVYFAGNALGAMAGLSFFGRSVDSHKIELANSSPRDSFNRCSVAADEINASLDMACKV